MEKKGQQSVRTDRSRSRYRNDNNSVREGEDGDTRGTERGRQGRTERGRQGRTERGRQGRTERGRLGGPVARSKAADDVDVAPLEEPMDEEPMDEEPKSEEPMDEEEIGAVTEKVEERGQVCDTSQEDGHQTLIALQEATNASKVSVVSHEIIDWLWKLNACCFVLYRQLEFTSQTTNMGDFFQGNLPCDETARLQGLFEVRTLPSLENIMRYNAKQLSTLNMLTAGDVRQKFAIPSYEGNPNGVLAVALYEAVSYLKQRLPKKPQTQRNQTDKDIRAEWSKIEAWETEIPKIFIASRKQKKDEGSPSLTHENTANEILKDFNAKIGTIGNDIEKLKWIFRVYGPFLNKGLSDISQAGELAKFYVLKYIEQKIYGKVPPPPLPQPTPQPSAHPSSIVLPGQMFWITTGGLPSLSAYSSDTIASALGVRIQNLFKGQFQSICPRKNERGNFMVVYIPYNYMSLMFLISHAETQLAEVLRHVSSTGVIDQITSSGLFDKLIKIKSDFVRDMTTAVRAGGASVRTVNFFHSDSLLFINLRQLVYNLYNFYKEKNNLRDNFFSENIFNVINFIRSNLTALTDDDTNLLIQYINDFYNLYMQISIAKPYTNILDSALQTIHSILLAFGSMIEELHTLMYSNVGATNVTINTLLENIWLHIQTRTIEIPSWTGILYSTISYYDNCLVFSKLTYTQLLDKFLEFSQMEIKCAILDVDKGHDQSAKRIGEIGYKFTEQAVKLQSELALRPTQDFSHDKNQKYLSKKLINKLHYCSVAISYDRTGNPILRVINSQEKDDSGIYTGEDFEQDFMFNQDEYISEPTRIVASINGIGSCENLGSIDYIKGKVPELVASKAALRNDFESYEAIIQYFSRVNTIELRFATSNFDAAAPSGCLYRNVGNQCLSYLPIKINGVDYIYIILTIDLNRTLHQNSLELTSYECREGVTAIDIFKIDDGDTELKNISYGISRGVPSKSEPRKYREAVVGIMNPILNNCYKKPDNMLKQILQGIPELTDLVDILDKLNAMRMKKDSVMSGWKTAQSDFPKECEIAFEAIVNKIQKYYGACKKETIRQPSVCMGNLKVLLENLYSCIFTGKGLPKATATRRQALTSDTYQQKQEQGDEEGKAAGKLWDMRYTDTQQLINDWRKQDVASDSAYLMDDTSHGTIPNYAPYAAARGIPSLESTKQIAYAAPSPYGVGQGFGATAATAINPEQGFGQGDNKLSRVISLNKPYFGSYEDPEDDVTTKIEKTYGLDYRKASYIYREAKKYYRVYGQNIESKSVNEQIEFVIDFIDKVYNRDHPGDKIYKITGGKRKTKKNKMHKNKVEKLNTKRRNKRIRKTKKRQIKRKRTTRRR